ncbi:MAG: hypothetical protein EA376_11860 [Phycisphaeraceae bacterium]|nr:MAG: hypothetical protein EA376_11860 [Phycisphaeraceae bacterium]
MLRSFLEPILAEALGCEAECRNVSLSLSGRLVIRDLELRIPEVDGPASEFLQVSRVAVQLNWREAFRGLTGRSGERAVRSIRFSEPTFRLSQSVEDGSFNIAPLLVRPDGPGVAPTVIPNIGISEGRIIFGEHGAGRFLSLQELRVRGTLAALDPARGLHAIELTQIDPADDNPMRMDGGLDLQAGSVWLDMTDIDLADWSIGTPTADGRALWRRLAIEGDVPRASLRYDENGFSAEFELAGVDMTTPVPKQVETEDEWPATEWMRIAGASGVIRFDSQGLHIDLTGLIEDLPMRIRLDTRGLALDAALRGEIVVEEYALSERPDFLPFTPPAVRRYFGDFSDPVADVAAVVWFERDAPIDGTASRMRVSGEFRFVNGVAAHKEFPYFFENISGMIRFDENARIELVDIAGVAPSGATVTATGWFQTGGGDAEMIISAGAVPVDDTLLEAMNDSYRAIVEAARDVEGYKQLLETGVVQTGSMRDETLARLNRIRSDLATLQREGGTASRRIALERAIEESEARVSTPVFEMAGRADVVVTLSRGVGEPFNTDISARFDALDLLPAEAPYPLRAHDLELNIRGNAARFSSPHIEGLSGARGELRGDVGLVDTPGEAPRTDIRATLNGAPIDELMLAAIPAPNEVYDGPPGAAPSELIRGFGLNGTIDARVGVQSNTAGDIVFSLEGGFSGLTASPEPMKADRQRTALMTDITGTFRVNNERLLVGPLSGSTGDGAQIEVELVRSFVGAGELHGFVRAAGLDVGRPVEDMLVTLAPEVAEQILELRQAYRPLGRLDALARIEGGAGQPVSTRLEILGADRLAFDAPGGRIELTRTGGGVLVTGEAIHFDNLQCDVGVAGDAPGAAILVDGAFGLAQEIGVDLRMSIEDARFEDPVLRAMVEQFAPKQIVEGVAEYNPAGVFDATLRIAGATLETLSFEGSMSPLSLSLANDAGRVDIPDIAGRIEFDQTGGRVEALVLEAPEWRWSADGWWRLDESGPMMEMQLGASGSALGDDLRSMLPEDARIALNSIAIAGGFELSDATLRYGLESTAERASQETDATPPAAPGALSFTGDVQYTGASYTGAFPVADVNGHARISATRPDAESTTHVRVDVTADQVLLAGMVVNRARAEVVTGVTPGLIEINNFNGALYGGRITASALVLSEAIAGGAARSESGEVSTTSSDEAKTRYEVDARAVSVDFGRLIATRGQPTDVDQATEESGGRLDAELSLSGVVGDPLSARGRGLVRVEGGRFARMPLLMSILEVGNLQPPRGESLQGAEAHFFIRGSRANFDTLFARSNSITVAGRGSASWPDLRLDLRFRTSGNIRVPFVSDLVDALRNELLAITVSGSLDNPRFGVTQLPATSDFLREVFQTDRPRRRASEATPSGG